jgi:DNA polymerase-3 subunit alpha
MLLSQNWQISKGDADVLRKAMGKAKGFKMKPKFISQAAAKGHAEDKLEKIGKTGKLCGICV